MKKLVFLHGAGSDKNAYNDLMLQIAKQFDAELISFNAPFPHPSKPNKFVWFNKFEQNGRRDAVVNDYNQSLEHIKGKLLELGLNLEDIILVGHSQGGGMAVHIGLEMKLNRVISVSGDLPYNIEYEKKVNIISSMRLITFIIMILSFILKHYYYQPMTLESLAKRLSVSSSLISHTFKKQMGISVMMYKLN